MRNAAMNRNFGAVGGLSLEGFDIGLPRGRKYAQGTGPDIPPLGSYTWSGLGFKPSMVLAIGTSSGNPNFHFQMARMKSPDPSRIEYFDFAPNGVRISGITDDGFTITSAQSVTVKNLVWEAYE